MFANWLKEKRLSKGLTQTELAKEIGVSQVIIAYFETGIRKPGIKLKNKLANYFGVSLEEIRNLCGKGEN
jgi:transcriptional regulator with XRE-family HTH domain